MGHRSCRKRGCRVTTATRLFADERWIGTHGIGRYSREVLGRVRTPWQPLRAQGSPSSARAAFHLPRAVRPGDTIYSPGYNAFATTKNPQLVTLHDLIHLDVSGPKRAANAAYYWRVIRPAIRRAGTVITVSETSRERISRWIRDDAVDIVNAGNAVSDAFVVEGQAVDMPRDFVLYVGNLRPHKNVDTLMRAVALSEFGAVFVLPADDVAPARQKLQALGLSDRAEVLHGIDDNLLAHYYRGAAVTAMPSTIEGFGLPALESVSCGTPVLYWSGCASVAEIVGERGVGVADAHNPQEWADQLIAAASLKPSSGWPSSRPTWDDVARRVDQTLTRFIAH